MTGEIHLTREVVDRLIRGGLSKTERQVLIEHMEGSGSCERCVQAVDGSSADDEQYGALLCHWERKLVRTLRRRSKAGNLEAEHELMDLRFKALMRVVGKKK